MLLFMHFCFHFTYVYALISLNYFMPLFYIFEPSDKFAAHSILHGQSMFDVKSKIYGATIINPTLSRLKKHLVIGSR